MMFDPDNPPENYKEFKKEVKKSVSEADIDVDETFDIALFTVGRDNQGTVTYVDDLLDEIDEDTDMQDVVEYHLPQIIRENNSKFFAFVFPGFELSDEEDGKEELVCMLSGALFEMHLSVSEVHRDESQIYAELGPWESHDPNDYLNLTIPFRRSITYQEG